MSGLPNASPTTRASSPTRLPYEGVYLYYKESRDRYVLQFKRRGRKGTKQITLKARTAPLAYAEAVDYGRRYEAGLFDPFTERVETVPLTEAVKRYLASDPTWSEGTRRERRITLDRFAGGLHRHTEPKDVTEKQVRAFALSRKVKPSTQQGYLSKLAAFFGWCVREGYLRDSPCDGVPKPRMGRRAAVFYTREQARALIAAAEGRAVSGDGPEWMPDLIRVALGTGLRQAELTALRWRDVTGGRVYVRSYVVRDGEGGAFEFRPKSGHDRAVPLSELARQGLESRRAAAGGTPEPDATVFQGGRSGGRLLPNHVGDKFRKLRETVEGLDGTHNFHALRHSFASYLLTHGASLIQVKDYLGHASLTTTADIYGHLVSDEAVERVVRSLSLG
jgi:integrase